MDEASTESSRVQEGQVVHKDSMAEVGKLDDQHCHLLLGEVQIAAKLCGVVEAGAINEGVAKVGATAEEASLVAAFWQQDLVQQRVRALAESTVTHFALQTVDLADLKLHVVLWPELERSPLSGRISLYAGLHPFYLKQVEALTPWLSYVQALRAEGNGAVVLAGIGEVGLDARQGLPLRDQVQLLAKLLDATATWQLPYSFHCVKAHAELLGLLSSYPQVHGTIHGFNGSYALGLQYVHKGLKLGLGRALLAPQNERKFAQLLATLTSEQWCLESDFDGSHGEYESSLLEALALRVRSLLSLSS